MAGAIPVLPGFPGSGYGSLLASDIDKGQRVESTVFQGIHGAIDILEELDAQGQKQRVRAVGCNRTGKGKGSRCRIIPGEVGRSFYIYHVLLVFEIDLGAGAVEPEMGGTGRRFDHIQRNEGGDGDRKFAGDPVDAG